VGLLGRARSLKALVCRLRDLGWGMIHSLTGWQPNPVSTLRGGRAYVSGGRLVRILSMLGCSSLGITPVGPLVLGHASQVVVVARKTAASVSSPDPAMYSPTFEQLPSSVAEPIIQNRS
jgi:hypothetical protein